MKDRIMQKKVWIPLLAAVILLVAGTVTALCLLNLPSGGDNAVDAPPRGDEFDFAEWQGDPSVYTEIKAEQDSVFVRYIKLGSMDNMAGLSADVSGKLSDYRYVSFTITCEEVMAGKTMVARLGDSTLSALLLGNDKAIVLEAGTKTYTYEIHASNAWMLDSLDKVYLIAEPGQRGATNTGTFTIERAWFSKTQPKDSLLVEGSAWAVWGGNFKIQQVGDFANVTFSGIKPLSWNGIACPVEHDFDRYNAFSITITNNGEETAYVRINPTYSENGENKNMFERASEVLDPGETKTVVINGLTRQLNFVALLINSSWDVPEGTYSGKIAVSEITFLSVEEPDWAGSSIYQVLQENGVATVTYDGVKPGSWNNIFTKKLTHSFPEQNAMKLTVTNIGTTDSYVRVVPMSSDTNLMEPASILIKPGETRDIVSGPLTAQVDQVALYICSGHDVPGTSWEGSIKISGLSFYRGTFDNADIQAWYSSAGYQLSETNRTVTVTYNGIVPQTTWENVFTKAFTHDFNTQNTVSFTVRNTGYDTAYIRVNPTDATHADMNLAPVAIAAGETKQISITLDKPITTIFVFVCSSWGTPSGTYSGSVVITPPVFSYQAPVEKSWFGSAGYLLSETDKTVTVTYNGIVPQTTWDNVYTEAFNHDFKKNNVVTVNVKNTGKQTAYVRMNPTDSTGADMNLAPVAIEPGATKAVSAVLDKKITKVVLFICSSWGTPGGTYSGSVVITPPVFSYQAPVEKNWFGSAGYQLSETGKNVTVTYSGIVPQTTWDNVYTEAFNHDFSKHNTVTVNVKNNGTQTAYVRMNPTDSTGADMNLAPVAIEPGATKAVSAVLDKKITKVVLFICSSWGTPGGTYSGSVELSAPVFSYVAPEVHTWFGSAGYVIAEDVTGAVVSYSGMVPSTSWDNIYNVNFTHDFTVHNTLSLTFSNTGSETAYIRVQPTDADGNLALDTEHGGVVITAGGTATVTLTLNRVVSKVTAFVCSSWDTPSGTYSGSVKVGQPVFSYVKPEIHTWLGSAGYTIAEDDTGATVSYSNMVPSTSWDNIYNVNFTHDFTVHNTLSLTFSNTGSETAYIRVQPTDADGNLALDTEHGGVVITAGSTATVTLTLNRVVSKVTAFICSSWDTPSGTYSGSVKVGQPVFSYVKPEIHTWFGSTEYSISETETVATVTYSGIASFSWKNIYTEEFTHDAATQNTMDITVKNTGTEKAYIRLEVTNAAGTVVDAGHTGTQIDAGSTETITLGITAKADKVVMFICSSWDTPENTTHSGSIEISGLRFYTPSVKSWYGSAGYTIAEDETGATVSYSNIVPMTSWDNIYNENFTHDFETDNTLSLTFSNTGSEAAYVRVNPTDADGNVAVESEHTGVVIPAGNSATVTLTLNKKVSKVTAFICSSWDTPSGTYSGSVKVSQPVFSYVKPEIHTWFGSTEYSISETETVATVTYSDIASFSWKNIYTEEFTHDAATQNTMDITVKNTGTEKAYIRLEVTNAAGTVVDAGHTGTQIDAGSTETITLGITAKADKVVMFICSSWDTPENTTHSGSIEISGLRFYTPFVKSWYGSDCYTINDTEEKTQISYENIPAESWVNISNSNFTHNYPTQTKLSMKLKNTGEQVAYIRINPTDSTLSDYNFAPVEIQPGGTETVEYIVDKQIKTVYVFICSSWGTPKDTTYSGSLEITDFCFN